MGFVVTSRMFQSVQLVAVVASSLCVYMLCCPNFGLLLRFLVIVTISCSKLLHCYLNVCFYRVFILLTWSLWWLVHLVGLVVIFEVCTAFPSGGRYVLMWPVSVSWP